MPLILAAAVALTEVDRFDLRCVWVSRQLEWHAQANSDEREVGLSLATWFEGRLAGRPPDLLVSPYVEENFTFAGATSTDSDLKACFDVFAKWHERDLEGTQSPK